MDLIQIIRLNKINKRIKDNMSNIIEHKYDDGDDESYETNMLTIIERKKKYRNDILEIKYLLKSGDINSSSEEQSSLLDSIYKRHVKNGEFVCGLEHGSWFKMIQFLEAMKAKENLNNFCSIKLSSEDRPGDCYYESTLSTIIYYKRSLNEGIYFNKEMLEEIRLCSKRFVIFNLKVFRKMKAPGHSNVIVIDKVKKEIERFEPYGCLSETTLDHEVDVFMYYHFLPEVNKVTRREYTYVPPIEYQIIGPQTKQEYYQRKHINFCATWSTLYLFLRLKHEELGRKKIVEEMMTYDAKRMSKLICAYAQYIKSIVPDFTCKR